MEAHGHDALANQSVTCAPFGAWAGQEAYPTKTLVYQRRVFRRLAREYSSKPSSTQMVVWNEEGRLFGRFGEGSTAWHARCGCLKYAPTARRSRRRVLHAEREVQDDFAGDGFVVDPGGEEGPGAGCVRRQADQLFVLRRQQFHAGHSAGLIHAGFEIHGAARQGGAGLRRQHEADLASGAGRHISIGAVGSLMNPAEPGYSREHALQAGGAGGFERRRSDATGLVAEVQLGSGGRGD